MLEEYQKLLKTKDGASILLRPFGLPMSNSCMISWIVFQTRKDGSCETIQPRSNATSEWIRTLDYDKVVPLVAVNTVDGSIIANIQLHRPIAECLRHMAHVRVMVDPSYRRQALGPKLLLSAVKLAMDLGIEKLAAEFVAGIQEPAIRAALKLDFFEQARLKDYVKDRNGTYHDLIIMVKTLQADWDDF